MENIKKALTFSELKIGMFVIDDEGDFGTVKECDDICNIFVEFKNGGTGLYCLDSKCKHKKDNLYIHLKNE